MQQGIWKKVALLGFAGILTIALSLIAFVRSDKGKSWVQAQLNDWLAGEYRVSLQYESMQITPSTFGWKINFQDLLWTYADAGPQQAIREASVDVNPWTFFFGSHPLAAVSIRGTRLALELAPDAIQLEGSALRFEAQALARILSESKASRTKVRLPDVKLEDIELDLKYRSGDDELRSQLILSRGSWVSQEGLTRLDLTSPEIEIAALARQSLEFAKRIGLFVKPSKAVDLLNELQEGWVDQLQLNCAGFQNCRGSGSLRDLHWTAHGWIPGVRGFSAHLELEPGSVRLRLPASQDTLLWPKVYAEPVKIAFDDTSVSLRYEREALQIQVPETSLTWNGLQTSTKALVDVPLETAGKTRVQIVAKAKRALWNSVRAALPDRIFSPNLNRWLEGNVRDGNVDAIEASLSGEILKFPFAQSKAGSFKVQAEFDGVRLKYLDDWPEIDACKGQLRIDEANLKITDIACQSPGFEGVSGQFEVPEMGAKSRVLSVQVKARSRLSAAAGFLAQSPLRTVGSVISSIASEAKVQETQIDLRLQPGQEEVVSSLSGSTKIEGAELNLPRGLYSGRADRIDVQFDAKGLERLDAIAANPADKTRIRILRDAEGNALDLTLEPLAERPDALKGKARLAPADSPRTLEGSVANLKVSGQAASVSLDRIHWQSAPDDHIILKGVAQVKDFGAVSKTFGLGDGYRKGQGKIRFDLSMPASAKDGISKYLSGVVDFDLADGQIENLSQTVVSLINVANLKIFGLSSDKLSYSFFRGRLNFADGALQTENTDIGLGVIEVRAEGSVAYKSDSMNMNLQIIPDLGSPAAAIAIGIWNPLAGLGLFGISKFQGKASDSRLNRMISQTYKLEGRINDPSITLIRPLDFRELFKGSDR